MGFFQDLLQGVTGTITGNPLGVLGGAISTGMGLFSGTKKQKKLMQYQNELQMQNYERERADKLADYQMQLQDQKEMIADERQYNSIGSQMQRARDANVSPLAALGVGSGNTMASVPSLSQASAQGTSMPADTSASHMGNSIQAVMSLKNIELRNRELDIQKQIADAQVAKTNAEADAIREKMPFVSQEAQARINDLIASGDLKGAQKILAEEQSTSERELRDSRKANIDAHTAMLDAERNSIEELLDSEINVNYWTAKKFAQDINESVSREDVNSSQYLLNWAEYNMKDTVHTKLRTEVDNLLVARDKMLAEIDRINSDTSLTPYRKNKMIAEIVRDYAVSGSSIVQTILDISNHESKDDKAKKDIVGLITKLGFAYLLRK